MSDSLVAYAETVTLALRRVDAEEAMNGPTFEFRLNDAVARGDLGPEYLRKSKAWLHGATRDFLRQMKTEKPVLNTERYYADLDKWEHACDEIENAKEWPPEPEESEYYDTRDFPKFGVGSLGSVWLDLDLTGRVDDEEKTKRTRVTLDYAKGFDPPHRIVLDATFDEEF